MRPLYYEYGAAAGDQDMNVCTTTIYNSRIDLQFVWSSLRLAPITFTTVMQGIFGANLTLHCVAQGALFALPVVDIELHSDSSLGCMACRCSNQTALWGRGVV